MAHKILSSILLIVIVFTGCKDNAIPQDIVKEQPIDLNKVPVLPCKEVTVIGKDSVKRKVMKESIRFFLGTHCFINNRGIVNLYISKDDQGNEVWKMYSEIEDNHITGTIPSPYFEDFDGDIVLVFDEAYQMKSNKMYDRLNEGDSATQDEVQAIRACIDQVIGNRVYQRPTRKDRWAKMLITPTDTIIEGINRDYTGTSCKRKVVFYKDGTYEAFTEGFY